MKISELAERSSIPLSTIKFYQREGLLPAGERTAPNQVRYGSEHLDRLDLIHALREVAGLSIEVVRAVLVQLDRGWDGGDPVGEALRAASFVALPEQDPQAKHAFDAARDEVRRFLSSLDWISPEYEGYLPVDALATALVQVRDYLFPGYPVEALAPYARVAWLLSEVEFAKSPGGARVPMPGDDITDPTRRAVLGSILFERIFASLRRAANTMRSIRTTAGLPLPPARVLPADRSPAKR